VKMISEERKARIREVLNAEVEKILAEIGASSVDEGLRILEGEKCKT